MARRKRRKQPRKHAGMVSPATKNYAKGNLLAGPSQWKRMYATGAAVSMVVNFSLIFLVHWGSLTSGSVEAASSAITTFLYAVVNSLMPLAAVMLDTPVQGIISALMYVGVGLFYWTGSYEMNRPKRGRA